MKKIYAIPSYNCNLNCPHCDVHKRNIKINEEKFFKTLLSIDADIITLFGGEPLLYKDIFYKCINTNKITNVSTNLLLLDDDLFKTINENSLPLATSWNPKRFTSDQYKLWLDNIKKFKNTNVSIEVLITLTEDLITSDIGEILNVIMDIDDTNTVDGILFEPLVDNNINEAFHERCDEWLCNIHKHWNFTTKNLIEKNVLNWNFDCSDTWTLEPSGELRLGCPQYTNRNILSKCLSCDLASKCRPCMIQNCCSFPKKLYGLINEEK